MGRKTYLERQIKLMTVTTNDLLTEEERSLNAEILDLFNKMETLKRDKDIAKDEKKLQIRTIKDKRKEKWKQLDELIASNKNIVRKISVSSVTDSRLRPQEHEGFPIIWNELRLSRRIAEFESEESRSLGLKQNEVTFDKIIVKWKTLELLRQIVMNGFDGEFVDEETGEIFKKHYIIMTASAGQLRTDKVQFISADAWAKISDKLMCGLTWEEINRRGGINVNKLMAYIALSCSATEPWDFDLDHAIVIKDFEANVTGRMKYITPDYTILDGVRTVLINHCDGCGMVLPSLCSSNFMIRAPWLKGLLSPFDFIDFCRYNNVPAVIEDVWGTQHDLVKEDIQVIFTVSQFKLWNFYDSWDHYKREFKRCGCHVCRTNYEEPYIKDTTINYQMLQTLVDMTDDEIMEFTKPEREILESITSAKEGMLSLFHVDEEPSTYYKKSLLAYDALLHEGYQKNVIHNSVQSRLMNDKSGCIKCANKRLFAIPDLYAACQFWFMHIDEPEGLIKNGEVVCKLFRKYEKIDVLRSPHLFMEHAVRSVSQDENAYRWLQSKGIYTSCKDLISRILQ